MALQNSAVTLQNCTVANNNPTGAQAILAFDPAVSALTIHNGILWNNALNVQWDGPTGTVSITYTDIAGGWAGEGNIDADPRFINAFNLRLQVGSPCIDKGTPTGAPLIDIDSYPRDAAPDMGAYEWQGFRIRLPLTLMDF
jgi:hypothetical protein